MRTAAPLLVLLVACPLLAGEPQAHRGLAYAEPKNERQQLDVYAPTKGKKLPVVVWTHGGGWQAGDKKDVSKKPHVFTDKGFVFVSINYRLLPDVTIKQMAGDVAKAIHWVHDHAKDYGGDPSTIREIERLRERVLGFEGLPRVPVSAGLEVILRPYQRDGLDFLAFVAGLGVWALRLPETLANRRMARRLAREHLQHLLHHEESDAVKRFHGRRADMRRRDEIG